MSNDKTITSLQARIGRLMDDLEAANQSADRNARTASSWQSKAAVQAEEINRLANALEAEKADKRRLLADLKVARAALGMEQAA